VPSCDYAEIIMVYLGKLGDKKSTPIGLLNTVFSKDVNKDERTRLIEQDYKISLDKSVFEYVEELMVNLDEDMVRYANRLLQEETKEKIVSMASRATIVMMEEDNMTFDSAYGKLEFPEEYREEVRVRVESEIKGTL